MRPTAFFWIDQKGVQQTSVHVAFAAGDGPALDCFYREALTIGCQDNGPPGIRVHYHPDYHGTFVLDPDDHDIEAV